MLGWAAEEKGSEVRLSAVNKCLLGVSHSGHRKEHETVQASVHLREQGTWNSVLVLFIGGSLYLIILLMEN